MSFKQEGTPAYEGPAPPYKVEPPPSSGEYPIELPPTFSIRKKNV